ncbi:MAG: hypothetical protein P8O91_02285 [Luminiphilus sp.]|nr:hypothetical protein [Luminiphilus sp.]
MWPNYLYELPLLATGVAVRPLTDNTRPRTAAATRGCHCTSENSARNFPIGTGINKKQSPLDAPHWARLANHTAATAIR